MNKIENFVLPEHTNRLYEEEAISSISLTREVAAKINEIVDTLNAFNDDDLEWKHEMEGTIRKGVIYMKDNLLNSLNDLMVLLRDSGFIDDRIEHHCDRLKERLDNLVTAVPSDAELLDMRVGTTGKTYTTAGECFRNELKLALFNKPEFYGAVGDGVHNDSEAMQKALNMTGCLYLAKGKKYLGNVTVKNPQSVICGGGSLLGGIVLYVDRDEEGYPMEGNILINDITIEGEVPVTLGAVRGFTISNCHIHGVEHGILFHQSSEFSQIVNKGIISNNRISAKTCIELRELNDTIFGGCADITISHNTLEATERNITLISVDGCKISNNTMFMTGFSEKLTTKKQNVYTQKTNWLTIENNTMFEAGEEGIRIESKSRNTIISGNIIGWCGQVKLSSGIYVGSYDTSGLDTYMNMMVNNNIISVPTKHGIEFGGYMVGVLVSNNMISEIGKTIYYYGAEDFDSIEHFGLFTMNQDNFDSILFADNVVTHVQNSIGTGIVNSYNLDAATNENLIMPSKIMRLPHKQNLSSGGIWYDAESKKLKYSDGTNIYTLSVAN